MMNDEFMKERVPVQLPNGATVQIEVVSSGREKVAFNPFSFNEITDVLEGVTTALKATLEKAQPQKASVTFGLEISVESGQLAAAIVKGSGQTNLSITLEWETK